MDKMLTTDQIIEIEKTLIAAVKKSEVPVLDTLLHDELVFHIPSGDVITKQMDLDAHRSGKMVVERINVEEQSITLLGDTAIVSVLLDTKGKMLDQPIAGRFRYIRVWKLFDAQLKVIGGSCIHVK